MTADGKDTIEDAEPNDEQPSHEAVKERPTALKTVKNGDENIAPWGNPAGLTIGVHGLVTGAMYFCAGWKITTCHP